MANRHYHLWRVNVRMTATIYVQFAVPAQYVHELCQVPSSPLARLFTWACCPMLPASMTSTAQVTCRACPRGRSMWHSRAAARVQSLARPCSLLSSMLPICCGAGPIVANDSLWMADIDPFKCCNYGLQVVEPRCTASSQAILELLRSKDQALTARRDVYVHLAPFYQVNLSRRSRKRYA